MRQVAKTTLREWGTSGTVLMGMCFGVGLIVVINDIDELETKRDKFPSSMSACLSNEGISSSFHISGTRYPYGGDVLAGNLGGIFFSVRDARDSKLREIISYSQFSLYRLPVMRVNYDISRKDDKSVQDFMDCYKETIGDESSIVYVSSPDKIYEKSWVENISRP